MIADKLAAMTEDPGLKNYITPAGYARLLAESEQLYKVERPELTRVVAWAASNGDRSENGDYLYGKRRLREIDRRLRYLKKQLDNAEVIDPGTRDTEQIFFAATVAYLDLEDDSEHTVSIVGVDEADVGRGLISWRSPLARALTKAREGDVVKLPVPDAVKKMRALEVLSVRYLPIVL
ncbi:MAG: transcription elongation factor GreB [Pseudomonadota bacterium]|jgi:transcription elongation factor GreB